MQNSKKLSTVRSPWKSTHCHHILHHTLHTDFASNIFQCIANVLHYFFTKKKNKKIKIRIPIKEILRIEVVYSQLTFSLSERKQILKFYKIKPMLMF